MMLKFQSKKVPAQPTVSGGKSNAKVPAPLVAVQKTAANQPRQGTMNRAMRVSVPAASMSSPTSARPAVDERARAPSAAVTKAMPVTALAVSALPVAEPAAPLVVPPQSDVGGAQAMLVVPKNRRTRREASARHIDLDQPGFQRLEVVLTLIPVSRATWYAGVKAGIYPAPIPLGRRAAAYLNQDIKTLIDKLSGTHAAPAQQPVNVGVVSATI